MIKKLSHIRKMAVFDAFDWDASVRDANNRPIFFKPLNVIYGRNYSGKTTLSRILHALENGEISDKYTEPEFKVEFADGTTVDQTSPTSHAHTVRVFNEDFVRSTGRERRHSRVSFFRGMCSAPGSSTLT